MNMLRIEKYIFEMYLYLYIYIYIYIHIYKILLCNLKDINAIFIENNELSELNNTFSELSQDIIKF